MMTQAFYTGLSGLKANQTAIDIVSDNLANTSTIGYRGYSSEFSNMFESMINTDTLSSSVDSSIGVGSSLNAVVMDESRGVFQLSDRSTDLAILGDGWFGIQGETEPMYTRDGSFTFDSNRDLVTHDGYYVLGTMGSNISNEEIIPEFDADGNLIHPSVQLGDINSQEKLRFPSDLTFPALPTTKATFSGNLSLDEDEVALSMGASVISSDGTENNLRLGFTKVDPQVLPGSQWNVTATVESVDGEIVYSTETGIINFGENAEQISNTLTAIDNQGTMVDIDLGTQYSGIIASSGSFFSSSSSSNGLDSGELIGYEVNKDAEIIATFTNGQQSSVGTIAVFHFANDRGLERVNGARFTQSVNSGEPIFFKDENNQNIIGTDITNFKLEGSNVRMEVGLTEIIILQRSYDANSKSLSTADQMLQKALEMDA